MQNSNNHLAPITAIDAADYEKLATMTEAERAEWPFAVGVTLPCDEKPTVTRYGDMTSADLMAYLMDTDGVQVTRWVAVDGPEWSKMTPVPGWRLVTKFNR